MSAARLPGMDSFYDRIMKLILYPLSYLSWYLGITRTLQKLVSRWPGVIILNYHRINTRMDKAAGGFPGNITSLENFNRHIEYVQKNFSIITPEELMAFLVGVGSVRGTSVLFTFDDGYSDTRRFGLPVLQSKGIPAVLFVTTGILKKGVLLPADKFSCKREDSVEDIRQLYLQDHDIHHISSIGFEIGAHSVSHPVLALLPLADQAREITESKKQLEELTGGIVRFFSYPIGAFTPETPGLVAKAGYLMAFGNRRRAVTTESDRFNLPRVSACNHPLPVFAFKIAVVKLFQHLGLA